MTGTSCINPVGNGTMMTGQAGCDPMTAHANSLTERVTKPVTTARTSGACRQRRPGLRGHPRPSRVRRRLAARIGRTPRFRSQRSGCADSVRGAGTMLVTGAQQQRFTPNLGLELARMTPIGAYPLLDYLVVTSDTVGSGVQQLARYLRLVGNPVDLEVRDEAGRRFACSMARRRGAVQRRVSRRADGPALPSRDRRTIRRHEHLAFGTRRTTCRRIRTMPRLRVRPASSWNGLTRATRRLAPSASPARPGPAAGARIARRSDPRAAAAKDRRGARRPARACRHP